MRVFPFIWFYDMTGMISAWQVTISRRPFRLEGLVDVMWNERRGFYHVSIGWMRLRGRV